MKAFWKWWREHVSFSSTLLLFALLIIWLHRLTDSSSLLFALVVVDAGVCWVLGSSMRNLSSAEERFYQQIVMKVRVWAMAVLITLDCVYLAWNGAPILATFTALCLLFFVRSFYFVLRKA